MRLRPDRPARKDGGKEVIYFNPNSAKDQCWVIDEERGTLTLLVNGHFVECVTLEDALGWMQEAKK